MPTAFRPKTRAFLEAKFDALYAAADAVMKEANPCAVRGGKCYSMREFPELHTEMPFCCGGCKHLDPKKGCTVQSLHCRLWTCGPLDWIHIARKDGKRVYSPMMGKLRRLTAIADHWGFRIWRGTREESVEKALRRQKWLADKARRDSAGRAA